MNNLFDLTEKKYVITGGAGVLGSRMAKDLAAAGAKVCIADNDQDNAEKVAGEINEQGSFAVSVKCNVLKKDEVRQTLEKSEELMGGVDGLINAAGGNRKDATASGDLKFFDIPEDAMHFVFNLNFFGTFLPSQVFGEYFADKKQGSILNVSSMAALTPLTNICGYAAAKAAVSNFTQWLSVHMAKNYSPQIRVNAIAPGFFLTEQNRFLLTDEKTGELTDRGSTIIEHTPMGEFGKPEDLSGTVFWLLSDASRFVTGTVIPIDGGFSAFSGV
ncbi:putative oxidoreductase [Sedimentisphaera cyanobacteriorum]|uniref:Putative oxidoreductase n=1 Tax=Sedimentisphaera cyanobacteriorum TaxID=1940790 RepID=A0A1Q2HND9_9BACT|nr:SDR family oxidoreductase [Sedimentisphaera cyanobacteriorum]AQQ08775.1 putative oxidoreductase [Sedimentisphaera cyanobacteriorum]